MSPIVLAALVGAIAGIIGSLIAGLFQRRKVQAEVDLTAAETAAIVLKELRAEREDLRAQVARLELEQAESRRRRDEDRAYSARAIDEMRALEARCRERLARAIQVMRANGLEVPPDLDGD